MHRTTALRHSLLAMGLACWAGKALAQAGVAAPPPKAGASATQAEAAPKGRPDQLIEHIHVEDSGAKIDELRVGGQTQSITVKPKSGLPEYEILPSDGKNAPPALTREGSPRNAGERVWKVLTF
jgi:hypothetical protein